MKTVRFMKNNILSKLCRISAVCLTAFLLMTGNSNTYFAAGGGLPDLSSLAGLSDLLTLFGDDSSNASSASSSGKKDESAGYLQELLELIGIANEIPMKEVSVSKIADQTYTGKELRPSPKLTYNGKTLKRGTDYSLTYSDNIKTGTGKCRITGKGSYKGTKTVSFKIVSKSAAKKTSGSKSQKSGTTGKTASKKDTSSKGKSASGKQTQSGNSKTSGKTTAAKGKFTVSLSKESYEYNGTLRKPSVKVSSKGKTVPASDYTVSYRDNKNVGKATVTVKGKNSYKGYEGTASFKILFGKLSVSSVKSTKEGTVEATWKKDSQAEGYQLEYSTNKNFSGNNVWKKQFSDSKTVNCTLEKLNSGKNYYFRIRQYKKVSGRYSYGSWSMVKTVKVK